jgi:PAS domain S-box-containing protein
MGFNSRVSRRILFWTMLIGGIVSVLISAGEAYLSYKERVAFLEQQMHSIGEFSRPTLINSLWAFDRKQVELQIKTLPSLSEISAVRLRQPGGIEDIYAGAETLSNDVLEISFALIHVENDQANDLGTLTLMTDLRDDLGKMMRNWVIAFLGNAFVIFVIVVVTGLIYHSFVLRRLYFLVEELKTTTPEALRQAQPEARPVPTDTLRDEFDDLMSSIVALKATGGQALREVDEKNAELRSLMNSLNESKILLQAIIDTAPIRVFWKDRDLRYLGCNPAFVQDAGKREAGEIIGKDDYQMPWAAQADLYRADDLKIIESGIGKPSFEEPQTTPDGQVIWLRTSKVPLKNRNEEIIGLLGLYEDITDSVRTAETLREREELYHSIVSQAGDGIVLIDAASLGFVEVNTAACRLMGYSRAEYLALFLPDIQPDLDETALRATIAQILVSGSFSQEGQYRRQDGTLFDVHINVSAIKLRGRDCLVAVWRDITQDKAARTALENEAAWHRALIQNSIEGIAIFNEERRVIEVNARFAQMLGYTVDEMLGRHPRDWELTLPMSAKDERFPTRPEQSSTFETLHMRKDGSVYAAEISLQNARIGGRPAFITIVRDISLRKQAEEEIKRINDELESRIEKRTEDLQKTYSQLLDTQFAMESVGIAITWADYETGRFIYANRYAAKSLGYSVDEMLQLSVFDIDPHFSPAAFEQIRETIKQQGHIQFETEQRSIDGSLIPVEMTIYYQVGGENSPPRLIAFGSNITRRKEIEQNLVRAQLTAETANIAKSAFLANMSHEIRTPLNAITGMAHMLRRSGMTPEQQDRLDKIETAGQHLLEIINAILDLSKIEAGKFSLEEAEVHLGDLLASVASMLQDRVQAKGLKLLIDSESPSYQLLGDPTRLRQALLNFATNALKFTETGTIVLRTKVESATGSNVRVHFEVQDTGIGIPAEVIPRLFSAFEQADNSTTRKYGGTGLGLAITKKLAELMGGSAGVMSELGVGSTFWFAVQLKKGHSFARAAKLPVQESAETLLQRDFSNLRILLVEDEFVNREVALDYLRDISQTIDLAEDGTEAVALAKRYRYDAILMDMQMPIMDGLEATRCIRQLPDCNNIPIIAMTANAFAEDKARCLAAGMNDFLTKPVSPDELFDMLLKWLPARA